MARKNILMISTNPGSLEPKSGGQVRFYKLLTQISRENNVTVLEPHFRYKVKTKEPLRRCFFNDYSLGKRRLGILADFTIDYIRKLIRLLTTERFDIIQVYSFRGIVAAKIVIGLTGKRIPLIYDAHNVYLNQKEYFAKYAFENEKLLVNLFCKIYVPFIERIAVKCADRIIAVSENDKQEFIRLHKLPSRKITVIPSGVDAIGARSFEDRKKIRKRLGIRSNQLIFIFHGWYIHFPNREAIDLIISYVAPQAMKIQDDAVFVIAGPDVPVTNNGNIRLVGFVENIYGLIQAADVAIAPILHGSGTRLKILDYMAMGKAIVTTKKGIEGINARNGKHAIITDKVDNEFIEGMMYLVRNPHERRRMGKNARDLVAEEYNWDKIGEKLDEIYSRILTEITCGLAR